MNKFIKNIFLLLLPLILWSFLIIVIDPFNYFRISTLISKETKQRNAYKLNPLLFSVIDFRNNPCDNILIGDSRTGALPIEEISRLSGETYKKITIDGAKLNEIFDLVYLADDYKRLKNLVIGINFNMVNEFGYANRVKNVKDILDNPLKYIFNRSVAEVCYYTIRSAISGKNVESTPPMSREEFWEWNIMTKAYHWYGKYKYSEKLHVEILKLDTFTKDNNIKLVLIIVPHHKEFHDRLVEFGLYEEELEFKKFLSKLNAKVIDYDYENEITEMKDNFSDPVHYNMKIGNLIVNEIWKEEFIIGRKLTY